MGFFSKIIKSRGTESSTKRPTAEQDRGFAELCDEIYSKFPLAKNISRDELAIAYALSGAAFHPDHLKVKLHQLTENGVTIDNPNYWMNCIGYFTASCQWFWVHQCVSDGPCKSNIDACYTYAFMYDQDLLFAMPEASMSVITSGMSRITEAHTRNGTGTEWGLNVGAVFAELVGNQKNLAILMTALTWFLERKVVVEPVVKRRLGRSAHYRSA